MSARGLDEHEQIPHLLSALRQGDRSALVGIESIAKSRLHDLPPIQWNTRFPQEILDLYAQAGKVLPSHWNLSSLEDIFGLLTDLERRNRKLVAADKATWTQDERNVLRWYPAVVVLRHCFLIREWGLVEAYINLLHVSAPAMWDYERRIGIRRRKISGEAAAYYSNVRSWERAGAIAKVDDRLAAMEGAGQPRNVSEAVRRVGRDLNLSDLEIRNLRTNWYRHRRKLLPSAGQ